MADCRIGLGSRLESPNEPTFFIEVLINLCTDHDPVNLNIMEKKLALLRRLKQEGYVLNCEENGCVSCELAIKTKNLTTKCLTTHSILQKYMKPRRTHSHSDQNGNDAKHLH